MNIGIVCYASVGGSGVVASELARCLADRGHRTHVISSDTPFRLRESGADVRFHRVETPGYPVFREPQYLLALANRLVQVARAHRLDIIHAHYAIPHAAAAYLARQILASHSGDVETGVQTAAALGAVYLAVSKGLRAYAELRNNKKAALITQEDVMNTGAALVSVFIRDPQFEGQTKTKLGNGEVADLLGLSQPAAGMRYLRAMRRLRRILGETPSERGESS